MARCCFCITTSPGPASPLHIPQSREGYVEYLARITYYRGRLRQRNGGGGKQRYCRARAYQSRNSDLPRRSSKFSIGKICGSNAGAISRAETFAPEELG